MAIAQIHQVIKEKIMAIFNAEKYRNDKTLRLLRTAKEIAEYLGFHVEVVYRAMDKLPEGSIGFQSKTKILLNHDALLDELDGKQQRAKRLAKTTTVIEPEIIEESSLSKYDLEAIQNGCVNQFDSRFTGLENRLSAMEQYANAILSNQDKQIQAQEIASNELRDKVDQILRFQQLQRDIEDKEYQTEIESARQRAIKMEIDKQLAANEAKMEFRLGKLLMDGFKSE